MLKEKMTCFQEQRFLKEVSLSEKDYSEKYEIWLHLSFEHQKGNAICLRSFLSIFGAS